jgi:hypothetical protein
MYLDVSNGYWFFGLTNTNGSVPIRDPDPDMTFNIIIAITSIIISRFLNGPLGPFDFVPFISFSSLDDAFCDVRPVNYQQTRSKTLV